MDGNQDEYEETLIYVDLDDVPSVDELFAVEPDDFLTCQSKRQRELPQPKKPMHSQLALKFYNLDSKTPILQVGSRFYSGEYEEPMGSYLMFQDKTASQQSQQQQDHASTHFPSSSSSLASRSRVARMQQKKKFPSTPRSSSKLKSIIPELKPPPDKVYGEKLCTAEHPEYELVANVHKVLRMRRTEVLYHGESPIVLPPTPSGQPAPIPDENRSKTSDVIAGKYRLDKNLIPTTTTTSSSSQSNVKKVESIVSSNSMNQHQTSTTTTTGNDIETPISSTMTDTTSSSSSISDNNIAVTSSSETLLNTDSTTITTTTTTMSASSLTLTSSTKPTSKTTRTTKTSVKTKTSVSKPSSTTTTSTRPTRNAKKK